MSQLTDILHKFSFSLILNVLVKVLWVLGIDRMMQNQLGEIEYGEYFSFFNLSLLPIIFLDMGINNYHTISVSRNKDSLYEKLYNILIIKMVLAVIYLVVLMLLFYILGYNKQQLGLCLLLGLCQVSIYFTFFFRSCLSGLHYFRIESIIGVIDKLLLVSMFGILYLCNTTQDLTNNWYVAIQCIMFAFTTVLAAITVFIVTKMHHKVHIRINVIKKIIRECYPYALLTFWITLYWRSDSVLLERLLSDGKQQTGIYASSYRLLDMCSAGGYLLSVILLPQFTHRIAQNLPIRKILWTLTICALVCTVLIYILFFIWAEEIMKILYANANDDYVLLFRILMPTLITLTLTYILGSFVNAVGYIKYANYWSFFVLCINISLNFVLIPHYKAFGCAITTSITHFIVVIGSLIMVLHALKKYQIQ